LIVAKHYSIVKMGWVSAAPGLGMFVGNFVGGWMTDKVLLNRLKPLILISTTGTVFGMWMIIHAPNNAPLLSGIMFITGLVFHMSYPAIFSYPMAVTTTYTLPIAVSVINMVGNIGAFLSPIVSGYLIDVFHNYEVVFIFMGVASAAGFLLTAFVLDEPSNPT
jgi:MFS family permease